MRTRSVLLGSTTLLAVLVLVGCGTDAAPAPSGTISPGPGTAEEVAAAQVHEVMVVIDIETQACNVPRDDCDPPIYDSLEVPVELDGDPVTVPFRGGELTVEWIEFILDANRVPVEVDLALSVIADGTQDFYGSYENGETGRDYYASEVDPYLFTYDHGWKITWPFVEPTIALATLEVEQWGGNGRYSLIDIQLYNITSGR